MLFKRLACPLAMRDGTTRYGKTVCIAATITFLLLVQAVIYLPVSKADAAPTVFDDFDDNKIDATKWRTSTTGSGSTIDEVNRALEISHQADASGSPFLAEYFSVCRLAGDFDIQVDYRLLQWPSTNGIKVGLAAYDQATSSTWTVERVSVGENERYRGGNIFIGDPGPGADGYLTTFNGITNRGDATFSEFAFTGDMSGTLRLVRSGSTITGYSGSDVVGTFASASSDDVHFILASWGYDVSFGDTGVRVAFDNMKMNQGTLVGCTPAESVNSLIQTVRDLGLPANVENSLTAPLAQTESVLADSNPNNDASACGKLDAFINEVNAKEKSGKLTSEQASQLRQFAQDIKAKLGCR